MGRPPCCDKSNVKRGLWTAEEDAKILAYVSRHGTGNWTSVPKKAGLKRCGKSCRLRWTNYLRPDLKHENFTPQEEELIIRLHATIGSRWSLIANQLPGRTDNDVKNFWNTKLRKKLYEMGIDPVTHKPFSQILADYGNIGGLPNKTTRFGSLNRDFRNAFMSKSEPISSLPQEFSNITNHSMGINIKTPKMEPIQDFSLNNSSWDLLTQIHAIQLATEASNNSYTTNKEIMQPNFFHEGSSSSSSASSSTLINPVTSPPPPPPSFLPSQPSMIQTTTTTPSSPFSWSDLLHEDIFLPSDPEQPQLQQQQQNEEFQWLSSPTGSSSTQVQAPNIEIPKMGQFKNYGEEKQNYDGIRDMVNHGNNFDYMGQKQAGYYPMMGGGEASNAVGSSSSSNNSFIEGILDQDSEMVKWEFPNLFDDPY